MSNGINALIENWKPVYTFPGKVENKHNGIKEFNGSKAFDCDYVQGEKERSIISPTSPCSTSKPLAICQLTKNSYSSTNYLKVDYLFLCSCPSSLCAVFPLRLCAVFPLRLYALRPLRSCALCPSHVVMLSFLLGEALAGASQALETRHLQQPWCPRKPCRNFAISERSPQRNTKVCIFQPCRLLEIAVSPRHETPSH